MTQDNEKSVLRHPLVDAGVEVSATTIIGAGVYLALSTPTAPWGGVALVGLGLVFYALRRVLRDREFTS